MNAKKKVACGFVPDSLLACAMGHVIVESGCLPGISSPCRCDECRLVASRLDDAGYMEGVDDKWWDAESEQRGKRGES